MISNWNFAPVHYIKSSKHEKILGNNIHRQVVKLLYISRFYKIRLKFLRKYVSEVPQHPRQDTSCCCPTNDRVPSEDMVPKSQVIYMNE